MKNKFFIFTILLALTLAPTDAAVRYVNLANPNPAPPYTTWPSAATNIQDAIDAAAAGDEIVVTNGVYATGGRPASGLMLTNRVAVTKPVTVRSVNGPATTVIKGYQVSVTADGDGAVRCAYLVDQTRLSGFTLANGATRTGDGSEQEDFGGGIWCESTNCLVDNCWIFGNSAVSGGGVYRGTLNSCVLTANSANNYSNCYVSGFGQGGGALDSDLSNCILIANKAIAGGGGVSRSTLKDCVLTGNSAGGGGGAASATLYRCMLAENMAGQDGGGAYESILSNCSVQGNTAQTGGGTFGGVLNNCTLTGNFAFKSGGGAGGKAFGLGFVILTLLTNCTLTGNSAGVCGGGASYAIADNCILYSNTVGEFTLNYCHSILMNYCCTTPLPPPIQGTGNFDNPPMFIDSEHGDFRLQPTSPCINAGNNSFAPAGLDLDGNPRIVGGTVDVGAYESQSPQSVISYTWLQQFGLPIDSSTDIADPDGDRFNNWQEWRAGTDPTNALSALRLLTPVANDFFSLLTWESVLGRTYTLERSDVLGDFHLFVPVATNIPAALDGNLTSYFDFVEDPWPAARFYRVQVE